MKNPVDDPMAPSPVDGGDGLLPAIERFSRRLNSVLDLDRVMDVLTEAISSLLHSDRFSLFLYDADNDSFEYARARGLSEGYLAAIRELHQILPAEALLAERVLVVEDMWAGSDYEMIRPVVEAEEIRSLAMALLSHRDATLGALVVYYAEPTIQDDQMRFIAQTLANQAAVAIVNARLYQTAQKRLAELSWLRELVVEINEQDDLQATLDVVSRRAAELLQVSQTKIYLYDATRNQLEVRAGYQIPADFIGRQLKWGEGLAGRVIQQSEPRIINHYEAWKGASPVWQDVGCGSVLEAPLYYRDDPLGVLSIMDENPDRAFTEDDLRLLLLFTGQVSVALANALLLENMKRRTDHVIALQRVSTAVTASLELSDIFQSVVEALRQVFDYALVSIHRLDRERLIVEAASPRLEGSGWPRIVELDSGIVGRVVRTGQPAFIANVNQDTDFLSIVPGVVTEACVPIWVDGGIWGALNVEDASSSRLREADLPLLELLSNPIAVAIKNARLFSESRQRVAELEALRDVSLKLASSLDVQMLLEAISDGAMSLVKPTNVHIMIYDEEQGDFVIGTALWNTGERSPAVSKLRPDGITATAFRQRQPIIINDARNHPLYGLNPEKKVRDWGMEAIAAFPLLRPGGIVGVMTVSFTRSFTFNDSITRPLALLADQAAVALENARLFELEAKRRQLADTLRQVAATVGSSLDFSEVASSILSSLSKVVDYDTASILVLDGEEFQLIGYAGAATEELKWERIPATELLGAYHVVNTGETLYIPDVSNSEYWLLLPEFSHIRSWMGVPLRFQGQVFGALGLDNSQLNAYSPSDIEVVQAFADQTAIALSNARLYEAAQQRAEETERLRDFNERLLHNLEEGILLEDAEDKIVFVNPRFCQMVGYSAGELLGQDTAMLLTPEMADHVDLHAARRADGEKSRYEAALLHREGHQTPVLVSATPLFQAGVFNGTLTVFTDIAQRKRTEETLLALNAAAVAVRRALDFGQVYQTVADELLRLDLSSIVLRFDQTRQLATVEHLAVTGEMSQTLLDASPGALKKLSLPLGNAGFLQPLLSEGRAVYLADPAEHALTFGKGVLEDWVRTLVLDYFSDLASTVDLSGQESSPLVWDDEAIHQGIRDLVGDMGAVVAPLIRQQQIVGVLVVIGSRLTPADLPAVEAFANQTSAALDNARLLAAERRERERAETLSEVARILSATLDLNEALHLVMELLHRMISYDSSSLFLLRDGLFYCYAAEGFDDPEQILGLSLDPANNVILIDMMQNPRVIMIGNTYEHPHWQRPRGAEHVVSWLGAPLVAAGRVIGVLMADKTEPDAYSEEDLQVIAAFADQVSVAIQRARHYSESQQRLRELGSLAGVSEALNQVTELDQVLQVVLAAACDLTGAQRGVIALLDEPEQTLRIVAVRGQAEGFAGRINQARIPLSPELTQDVQILPPLLVDPDDPAASSGLATRVVLSLDSQIIGVIELDALAQDANSHRLLAALADLAAVAIDKARLFEETRDRAVRLAAAYDDLRQLDRMKDEFVQNVSHELRTPLTFVKGYVEYLLEGIAGDLNGEQQEALEIVLDRTDVIIRLVNDIISLKRAEMEALRQEPVALAGVAEACVRGALSAAKQAGVEIVLDIQPPLPLVLGDSHRLGEVFDNLIGNALKFSPDGGQITVRLRHAGDRVITHIQDTGIGIPPDQIDKIWQRFYQVDSTATRRFGGTGLGLTIVKRIIEAHNGAIWVESEPDQGATFTFSLPVLV